MTTGINPSTQNLIDQTVLSLNLKGSNSQIAKVINTTAAQLCAKNPTLKTIVKTALYNSACQLNLLSKNDKLLKNVLFIGDKVKTPKGPDLEKIFNTAALSSDFKDSENARCLAIQSNQATPSPKSSKGKISSSSNGHNPSPYFSDHDEEDMRSPQPLDRSVTAQQLEPRQDYGMISLKEKTSSSSVTKKPRVESNAHIKNLKNDNSAASTIFKKSIETVVVETKKSPTDRALIDCQEGTFLSTLAGYIIAFYRMITLFFTVFKKQD